MVTNNSSGYELVQWTAEPRAQEEDGHPEGWGEEVKKGKEYEEVNEVENEAFSLETGQFPYPHPHGSVPPDHPSVVPSFSGLYPLGSFGTQPYPPVSLVHFYIGYYDATSVAGTVHSWLFESHYTPAPADA